MNKFVVFSLLFLSHQASAIEEVLRGLDKINEQVALDCSQMNNAQLSQECALELCGSPSKRNINVKASEAANYLAPSDVKKLQHLENDLRVYFQNKQNEINTLANEFNKRKDRQPFSDISSWNAHDLTPVIDYYWSKMALDVDFTTPVEKRKLNLTTSPNHNDFAVMKELTSNFDIKSDPLRSYQYGLITFEEFKNLINKKIDEYQQKLQQLNKKSQFPFDQIKFALASGTLKNEELISRISQLQIDAASNDIQIVPNICKDTCLQSTKKLISHFNPSTLKDKLKSSLNRLNVEDRIASCKANFLASHITNTRQEEFKKMWPEIKSRIKSNVTSRFSAHSQKVLNDYLDSELNFIFSSPDKKNYEDKSREIKDITPISNQTSDKELIQKTFALLNQDDDLLVTCGTPSASRKVWDLFAPVEYIRNNPQFRPDGLKTYTDNVTISPYACEHQMVGKGIIAHELGHAISARMSRSGMSSSSVQDFIKLRKCASQQWKNNPNTQIVYFKGDRLFTEEDTADLISYLAYKEPKDFYGCVLLMPDENKYNVLNTAATFGDNHSPGLIRLLREIQYKVPASKIPATCQELIKRNPDKFGKSCI